MLGRVPARRQEHEGESARAHEMQAQLLPEKMPEAAGFRIACAWQPSKVVSGDYFDVFPLGGEEIALCIADVSGKGLEAAQLASDVQAAVRRYAAEADSPAELCTQVNRALSGSTAPEKYITLFYGMLEPSGKLRYENAGHCQPLLVRKDGGVEFPASFSGVVGIFSHWLYQDQEVQLRSGDYLLLVTDGILAAENHSGEEFGYRRLIAEVERRRGGDAQGLADGILEAVAEYCDGRFRDDASLIAVRKD